MAVIEQPVEQQVAPQNDGGLAQELQAASDRAGQFFEEAPPTATTTTQRLRDEHGRFIPKNAPVEEAPAGEPAAPQENATTLDEIWVEAAKQEGISDDVISTFKNEDDVQNAIAVNRLNTLRRMGIDPQEYVAWQQSRQQPPQGQPQAQPAPQQTPAQAAAAQALEDLKLEINEDEIDPSIAKQLKGFQEYVNKLKANLPDAQRLQRELDEIKAAEKQRADYAAQAQLQQQQAARLDTAASKVPELESYFGGKLPDVWRAAQTNPNDPRIADLMAFDAYFVPALERARYALGDTEKALEMALRNAWNAAPFSKLNGSAHGKNGNSASNRGVVRQGARRTAMDEPLSVGSDINVEMKRISEKLGIAWDNAGGNPFSGERA